MKTKKTKDNGFIYKGVISPLVTNGGTMPVEVGPEEDDEKAPKQIKKQTVKTIKKT